MRRALALAGGLGVGLSIALATLAPAVNYAPTCIRTRSSLATPSRCAPRLTFTVNGGFAPTKLPKRELAPIALNFEAKARYDDGTQPPALKEVLLELDKYGAIEVAGLRACGKSEIAARGVKAARRECRESIVGTGVAHVGIEPTGQEPLTLPLTLFNGGVRGGTTTLFVHSSVATEAPSPIVATVKVKRIDHGRYGWEAAATIPAIAGGAGSVLDFSFTIRRSLQSNGAERHYALARCADGHLNAYLLSVFSDGTKLVSNIVRSCQVREVAMPKAPAALAGSSTG